MNAMDDHGDGMEFSPEIEAILSKPTMTTAEFAKVMGIGLNQGYAAVRERQVRSLRLGSRILIPTIEVRKMLGLMESQ